MNEPHEMHSLEIQSVITYSLCLVTDDNSAYHGDHFEMFKNIKSLCLCQELT